MSVAAAIIGGLSTAAATYLGASANRRANESLAEKEAQHNRELWSLQNQYNSPTMQVARLKAANLSPAVAYGGNGQVLGNADPIPNLDYSGAMATPAFDVQGAAEGFNLVANGLADLALKTAQKDNLSADTARTLQLKDSELKALDVKARLDESMIDRNYKEMEFLDQSILNCTAETKNKELVNEYLERSMEDRLKSVRLQNDLTLEQTHEVQKKMEVYSKEIDKMISDIKVNAAQIGLIRQNTINAKTENELLSKQVDFAGKQIEEIVEKIRKAGADAGLSEKELQWYTTSKVGRLIGGIFGVSIHN